MGALIDCFKPEKKDDLIAENNRKKQAAKEKQYSDYGLRDRYDYGGNYKPSYKLSGQWIAENAPKKTVNRKWFNTPPDDYYDHVGYPGSHKNSDEHE